MNINRLLFASALLLIWLLLPVSGQAANVSFIKIVKSQSNIYQVPDNSSHVLDLGFQGDVFQVLGKTKYYYQVITPEGNVGFVRKLDVIPTNERPHRAKQAIAPSRSESSNTQPYQPRSSQTPVQSYVHQGDFTQEWQVRTLRTMGCVEIASGLGLVLSGVILGLMSSDQGSETLLLAVPGIAVGIPAIYIGYQDLRRSHQIDKKAFWGNKQSSLKSNELQPTEKTVTFSVFGFQF